jgi:DNA replication protein DnaC
MEKAAQANRELLAFMATQPQSKPCKFHSDCIRLIDEEATKEATRYFYFIDGKFHAGYAPCPKCVQDAANNGWKKFGVPEILIHATFENYTPDSEVEASHVELVKAFCAKRTGFLPLLGGYGTGKAHLAVAALRSFGSGWIVKQASLLCALRDTYSDKTAFDPIERAQSARLLVLGDVGLSAGGRDELPMLHEILDYRHGERLPTIITSNLPFEKLTPVLGERMADRLRESAFRVLTFTGTSHRREARARYFDAPPVEPPRPA